MLPGERKAPQHGEREDGLRVATTEATTDSITTDKEPSCNLLSSMDSVENALAALEGAEPSAPIEENAPQEHAENERVGCSITLNDELAHLPSLEVVQAFAHQSGGAEFGLGCGYIHHAD